MELINIIRFPNLKRFLSQIILALFIILLPYLCWGGMYNDDAAPEKDKEAKTFNKVNDKSVIYVYRENSIIAIIQAFRLYIDNEIIVDCTSGTFVRLTVKPGSHTIGVGNVSSRSIIDSVSLKTEKGGIYYVKLSVGANIFSGVPKLKKTIENEAQKEIKKLTLIKKRK